MLLSLRLFIETVQLRSDRHYAQEGCTSTCKSLDKLSLVLTNGVKHASCTTDYGCIDAEFHENELPSYNLPAGSALILCSRKANTTVPQKAVYCRFCRILQYKLMFCGAVKKVLHVCDPCGHTVAIAAKPDASAYPGLEDQ
eukprot:5879996-Amphidinium_carterae.1